jgi:hypothetical protein
VPKKASKLFAEIPRLVLLVALEFTGFQAVTLCGAQHARLDSTIDLVKPLRMSRILILMNTVYNKQEEERHLVKW